MRTSFTSALALAGTVTAAAVKRDEFATTPCGLAQAAAQSFFDKNPKLETAFIKPSLAYNCLKSIPVDKKRDKDLLNYLEPYVAFQSTLEPLANPPESYLIPGVDVLAGFGQIRAKLSKDEYKSQIDFAVDLTNLFYQAADGHFFYNANIMGIFQFTSQNTVVSVADEVTGLPRVYLRSDFLKDVADDVNVYDIESIDGVPIVDFLEAQSFRRLNQDPDAKYNQMFTSAAMLATGSGDGFLNRFVGSTPDSEVIKFTNGSTLVNQLFARVSKDNLPYIGSPKDIREAFEIPATTTAAVPKPTATESPDEPTKEPEPTPTPKLQPTSLPGYPAPVVKHPHDWISGYFLEGKGYENVAVLAVLGFAPFNEYGNDGVDEIVEARKTLDVFLNKAKAAGKTKLIIDVQGNGGGLIFAGYQMYNQLFPKVTDIWDGSRLRASEALNVLGNTGRDTSVEYLNDFITSVLDEDRKPYKEWKDLFGPVTVGGQNVTNIVRFNMTEVFPPPQGKQAFAAEDIVVVTDGFCGSTCTIFTGLMVREQGVRTIALGGRPIEAAMQAVGGVEGSQVYKFTELQQFVKVVGRDAVKQKKADALRKAFGILPDIVEPPLLPGLADSGSFNWRNAYARRNHDGYPEQFRYEAANCRLFYTDKMIVDPVAIWAASADAAFKGGKCVAGSTVHSDHTIGDRTVVWDAKFASKAKAYAGPGALGYKGAYEAPQPYVTFDAFKRSVSDDMLLPAEDFEYKFGPKIGGIEEYWEQNVGEDFEYKIKDKMGRISQVVKH
ncbi:peptidase s41 family protein [Colletotrichum plurivorum]|uniref:Peptidase s41 family protein n=1 Tax=Colletotrichum plurivorum TaxID=2175906 RepID=A0A8H6K2V3_9PEZI|nr:peptidase s41 family protein [Colletotrichum plurivorum]